MTCVNPRNKNLVHLNIFTNLKNLYLNWTDQYNTGEVSSQYNSYHQTSVNQPQMVGQQPKMGGQAEGLHFINQGRFKKKYM